MFSCLSGHSLIRPETVSYVLSSLFISSALLKIQGTVPWNTYILLDVLLCSTAEYFYELCRILTSPYVGRVKMQTTSNNSHRYYTTQRLIRDLLSNTLNCHLRASEFRRYLFTGNAWQKYAKSRERNWRGKSS